ncbi:MAG: NAD-dependent succinate-semialdehyde dehydrogenase, partial [SAR324 cluster bacterium]|nr:NAD-dependent succinate-semialdehyde dehydrogenase [SAR324 cluster bacterium]
MKLKDKNLLCQRGYINGEWVDADSKKVIEVSNPATGEIVGTVPNMETAETRRAIHFANEAFPGWRSQTAKFRSDILRKWYNLLIENIDDLAAILTSEQGKPLSEAIGEIQYTASFIEWFSEEAKRTYGDVIPTHKPDARIVVTREPVGVVAAITPWNFPLAMIARKVGPALAVGCTMVYKPATYTPLSAYALAYLGEKAGIPPGVFNVITGGSGPIGKELTSNPIVRKLTFTGSTSIGKKLLVQCAETVKKVSMELGGNAPFIVFDDASLDDAIQGAMVAKFRNMGQSCIAANRFYVQSGIYDEFVNKFSQKIREIKVGNGFDKGVTQGPLIDMAGVEKVEEHVKDAIDNGAKVVIGGKRHSLGRTFYEPTVISGVTQNMLVCGDETFGPLSAIIKFENEKEVIGMANDTEYGLASYLYTRDLGRAWRVSEALEYGMVGINEGLVSAANAPFGGVKESGLGREGSKYGTDDYTEMKYLLMGGI